MRVNDTMTYAPNRLASFLLLLILSGCTSDERPAEPLTAEVVVARAAATWGGPERLDALRGMRAEVTYPDHDYPVTVEVERPNRVRSTGGDRYISVFDGERAAFLHRINRDGEEKGPSLVDPEEVKDWELEIAWVFPAFFDHAAEYLGMGSIDGKSVHTLRVLLPLGVAVDYHIDAATFTTIRAEATATIGENTYTSGRIYGDFENRNGVLYPTTMGYYFGDAEPQKASIDVVEFGVSFPGGYFAIPEGLGEETP
jgi:hypothetical protein